MSLSKEERIQNCKLALELMLLETGDGFLKIARCDVSSPIFKDIKTTTWRELEQRYLIEDESTLSNRRYILTGEGWRTALDLNWNSNKALVEARSAKLAKIFKEIVKGRQNDGYVFLDVLASASEIPAGWICSAIEANLLEHKFNMRGVEWEKNGRGSMITIPVDFGLEPLDEF
jgi:hypothetical protein